MLITFLFMTFTIVGISIPVLPSYVSGSGNLDQSIVLKSNYFFCFLLLPLDWPPPRLFLIFAIRLFLLESLLFSLAAFLFTCLLPFDFPTTNIIVFYLY